MTDREIDRLLMEASGHLSRGLRALQEARETQLVDQALSLANGVVLARQGLCGRSGSHAVSEATGQPVAVVAVP